MTQFFEKEYKEVRRDGEALVDWDIQGDDVTLEKIRETLKGRRGRKAALLRPFQRKRLARSPIGAFMTSKGAPSKRYALTKALRASLDAPADSIPVVREFCEKVGLEASRLLVVDVIVQCQLYYALSGSAPHFIHLFDRVDGKVPNQTDVRVDGKAGISEAMAAMMAEQVTQEELEYEESDPDKMELLTGCKEADAEVVDDGDYVEEVGSEDIEDA